MSARIAMAWMRSITRLPSKLSQANCNYYSINRLLSVSGYSSSTRSDLRYSSRTTKLVTPCYYQAQKYLERVALVDQHATHTYSDLVYRCNKLTETICDTLGAELDDINAKRVTYLCPNDVSHVITQWGIWGAGGVAVPLSPAHPTSELEYVVQDTKCSLLVTTEEFRERMEAIAIKYDIPMITLNKEQYLAKPSISEEKSKADELREASRYGRIKSTLSTNSFKHKPSLIVYTSGTTGPPKGVVHTFGSIQAQIEDMVTAWGWTSRDVILHVLPLHHVHGIVNIMMTPLLIGATCVMLPTFDASQVWSTLLSSVNPSLPRSVNVFMAVPTIYAKLIEDYESRVQAGKNNNRMQDYTKAVCSSKIRLMVSGSAALPQPIMERWEEITGHKLLERYGMTEFGMGLTNPLNGNRTPGAVGSPFPQVEVCIAKPNVYSSQGYDVIATGTAKRTKVTKGCDGEEGELYVKGPNMFKEYLNKPDATRETFTKDGWFKTGDTACYDDGVYKILGRTSVDIIKSGGYKISALDIERHLLSHPDVKEAVVVGLPDMTWGQKVAAVLLLNTGSALDLSQLKSWARDKMPSYHIPSVLKTVENIPRNAMGKVNKKELVAQLFAKELKSTRS